MNRTSSNLVPAAIGPSAPNPPTQELPFHRLGLLPEPRWWRPLLVAGATLGMLLLIAVAAMAPVVVYALASRGLSEPSLDANTPAGLVLTLGSVILLLPSALIAVRLAGRRPAGTLSSVAGRLRWRLIGYGAGVTGAVMLPVLAVQFLLSPVSPPPLQPGRILTMLAIVLLLTPFQAAAEEYVFRGLLPQLIGGWLRNPLWAYTLPVALFTAGHLYDVPGLLGIAAFGLVAGWLTWRSGGLELAIGVHTVNNVLALGLGAFGMVDLNGTAVGWAEATVSTGYTVVVALVLWRLVCRLERAVPASDGAPAADLRSRSATP